MALFKWEPPSWIDREAWEAFEEMRRAKGKRAPFTDRARDGIIRQLTKLRDAGNDPAEVLWQSVRNGWTDVYGVKIDKTLAVQQTIKREETLAKEKEELHRPTAMPPEIKAKLQALTQKMRVSH